MNDVELLWRIAAVLVCWIVVAILMGIPDDK